MVRELNNWSDPSHPDSYGSARTWKTRTGAPLKSVQKCLSKQDGYILHKTPTRKFRRRKIVASGINKQWVLDLADMSNLSEYNDVIRFIMVAIDVVSRKLYTATMTSKHATSSVKALQSIFEDAKCLPKVIQFDKGTEFYNNLMKVFFKSLKIKSFSTEDDIIKGSLAERVIRTTKRKIYMHMTQKNTRIFL